MNQIFAKCLHILRQKIYKIINILIDLAFGIFHFFVKHENWYIRYANMVKFIATAFFNTLDIFQTLCRCCRRSEKKPIDNGTINEVLDNQIENLQFERSVLIQIRDEPNKNTKEYQEIHSKAATIRKLKKEKNDINIS